MRTLQNENGAPLLEFQPEHYSLIGHSLWAGGMVLYGNSSKAKHQFDDESASYEEKLQRGLYAPDQPVPEADEQLTSIRTLQGFFMGLGSLQLRDTSVLDKLENNRLSDYLRTNRAPGDRALVEYYERNPANTVLCDVASNISLLGIAAIATAYGWRRLQRPYIPLSLAVTYGRRGIVTKEYANLGLHEKAIKARQELKQ